MGSLTDAAEVAKNAAARAAGSVASAFSRLRDALTIGEKAAARRETRSLRAKDKKLIDGSAAALRDVIGQGAVDRLLAMSARERIDAIERLTERLKGLYDLPEVAVVYDGCLAERESGRYRHEERTLYLSLRPLLTGDREATRDFLNTVFHEFRHAVQMKMAFDPEASAYRWYDRETARAVAKNVGQYIRADEDPRGYYEQFAEADAREFAAGILREA